MHNVWRHLVIGIRLQLRSPMALVYTFLIPLLFLIAIRVVYRHESQPLGNHLGQLLALTALSGACFGLPAQLVGERERGIWRRYRLTPVAPAALLASVVLGRYALLLAAAVMQLSVVIAIEAPPIRHPLGLWIAFTATSAACLGVGLVIAMLADTVAAAQAIAQSVFLPMLILGGLAVRLDALPDWARQVAHWLPGPYAVETLQWAASGKATGSIGTALMVLTVMAVCCLLASAAIFRWDVAQRVGFWRASFVAIGIVAAWIATGTAASWSTRVVPSQAVTPTSPPVPPRAVLPDPEPVAAPPSAAQVPKPPSKPQAPMSPPVLTDTPSTPTRPASAPPRQRTWSDVTMADIELNLVFAGLPPDHGVVTPISADFRPSSDTDCVKKALDSWAPGGVADPLQRARNLLALAAVVDVLQLPIERDLPIVIFDRLQKTVPQEHLTQILYWIATHPDADDLDALTALDQACLAVRPPDDGDLVRERIGIYATKLLGRLIGKR